MHHRRRTRPTQTAQYLDIPAVMVRWGCSYDYVWQRLRRGEIEGMRLGRSWRIALAEIERAEVAMRTAPAA